MVAIRAAVLVCAAVLASLASAGCGSSGSPTPPVFTLTSPDVDEDGRVPEWAIGRFGGYCDGSNRSINLQWSAAPAGTRSFVVVMTDDSYVHWVVTGIPATVTELSAADDGRVSSGVVGRALSGPGSYIGPCVAGHSYVFTAYALEIMFRGDATTALDDAMADMDGHILAESSLTTRRS